MIQGRIYRSGRLTDETITVDSLEALDKDRKAVYWLDLVKPEQSDIDTVARILDLDSTHAEDAFKGRQRPKLEMSRDYLYINAYTVAFPSKLVTSFLKRLRFL